MTCLVAEDLATQPAGQRFRALVERPGILQLPGAYNGLSALQAKAAAARKARRHLYIVARTDAVASEGFEAAIAHEEPYAALKSEGWAKPQEGRMQTRA